MRQPSNLAVLRAAWRVVNGISDTSPCWRIENAVDTPKLYISGMIGGYDMDAVDFVQAVHAINANTISVHLNSPGGFVWDALSMYEALKSHRAIVTMHVDGIAGSAASFVLQAGDERVMGTGTRVMIHDAQISATGSPAEIRELADIGDEISNDLAGIYAERAGGTIASWRKAMSATTWYSAQQAVDAKLADRVATKTKSEPENRASQLIRARARVALGGVN